MTRPAAVVSAIALLSSLLSEPSYPQQQIEYGSAADLAEVHSVFIDTGTDMDDHDNIARIVTRELPMLAIAAKPQEAEVILVFRSSEATYYAGAYTAAQTNAEAEAHATGPASVAGRATANTHGYSVARYETIRAGGGRVFRVTPQGDIRLILSFEGSKRKGTIWKQPRTKFAEKFIDAYRDANPGAAKPSDNRGAQDKPPF